MTRVHSAELADRFGVSATRYGQEPNALLDRPEALEYDPQLVNRLLRVRDARTRARSARALDNTETAGGWQA